jgi:hypothetical protein
MKMVWIAMSIQKEQVREAVAPNAIAEAPIVVLGYYMGYLPIYQSYEKAVEDFPHATIISLGDKE